MEYRLKGSKDFITVTGTEITGLAAGTYEVRFAAKEGYNAGVVAEVIVAAYVEPKSKDVSISEVKVAEVEATLDTEDAKKYTVTVPNGIVLTKELLTLTLTEGATKEVTFENNVYTVKVTAEDGITTETYTITVTVADAPKTYVVTFGIKDGDTEVTDAKIEVKKGETIVEPVDGVYKLETGDYRYTVTKEGYKEVTETFKVIDEGKTIEIKLEKAIDNLDKVSYSFEAKLDKNEYNTSEDIKLSGMVLKDKNGLANTPITIKVMTETGKEIVTIDEVKTDEEGKFTYTFKVPKETEAGTYKLKVQANEPINKLVEVDLIIVKEQKPEVKVTFNHTEYAVEVGGYIPEKGDLIVTTTGLKDEEIKSVVVKSSDESIVEITQRPEWPEGGYPKSKTRAFGGKTKKSGNCSIIAIVTDVYGNEYTAECKVTVKKAVPKIDVTLYYYDIAGMGTKFKIKDNKNLPSNAGFYRVIVEGKETGIANIYTEPFSLDIKVAEVQQAEEITVQFFYDDKGEKKVGEVQVKPILQ